ncbi:MAG: HAD-IA family hydrolase [Alphaproteobacteria bacterium]|nr:HAD-IA family hydrolase [Alphaproteobacteria bacterium]
MKFKADKLKNLIDNYDVVSFDIFDTLLLRPYAKPVDLFSHLEQLENVEGFAEERVNAERRTRRIIKGNNPKYEDITLDEIYEEINPKFKSLKKKELDLEGKVLFQNSEIYNVYKYALRKKKKVIFVSDMYLPATFLKKVVEKNGYDKYEKLYVSSEYRKGKGTGNLYKEVLKDLSLKAKNVVHIGDNHHSDFVQANNIGIKGVHYPKVLDRFIKLSNNNKKIEEFIQRHKSVGGSALIMQMAIDFVLEGKTWEKDYWYLMGKYYGGSLAYTYCDYISEIVSNNNLKDVVFVARDGYSLEKVFNILMPKVKTHYVYAPRIMSEMTSFAFHKDDSILKRAMRRKASDILNKDVVTDEELEKFSAKKFKQMKKYISSFKLDKKFAMVDTITGKFSSQSLLEKLDENKDILGIYWHILPEAKVMSKDFKCDNLIEEKFNSIKYWTIFEFFIGAPERPIKDLDENNKPVYIDINKHEEKRLSVYGDITQGIIDLTKELTSSLQTKKLFFSIEDVVCLIDCLCYCAPTNLDKKNFSGIYFAPLSDHKHYEPLMISNKGDVANKYIRPPWNNLKENSLEITKDIYGYNIKAGIPYVLEYKRVKKYDSNKWGIYLFGVQLLKKKRTATRKKNWILYIKVKDGYKTFKPKNKDKKSFLHVKFYKKEIIGEVIRKRFIIISFRNLKTTDIAFKFTVAKIIFNKNQDKSLKEFYLFGIKVLSKLKTLEEHKLSLFNIVLFNKEALIKENIKSSFSPVVNKDNKYEDILKEAEHISREMTPAEKAKTSKLKNKYKGKKCIIIGGAPSINDLDLSKLNNSDYILFSANRGYKLKEKGLNKTHYHFLTDSKFIPEFESEIDKDFADSFIINTDCVKYFKFKKDYSTVSFFHTPQKLNRFCVSDDMTKYCHSGFTVVSIMLMMARYMGIKEIYLIGVDLSFNKDNNHFYKDSKGEQGRCLNNSIKDKEGMFNWIKKANKAFTEEGIKLRNASPNPKSLDFMKKIKYSKLF